MVVRFSALRTGRFYPQEILLVLISVRGWVDSRATVRSEGLCQWKIPMTPSGIEPATFRLVAQRLNHCATAVPLEYVECTIINVKQQMIELQMQYWTGKRRHVVVFRDIITHIKTNVTQEIREIWMRKYDCLSGTSCCCVAAPVWLGYNIIRSRNL